MASPASAADTAYNNRTQVLATIPIDSLPNAHVSRSIYLASGNYKWAVGSTPVYEVRDIYLAAGTYAWNCTLDPKNRYYEATCSLQKSGTPIAYVGPVSFSFEHVNAVYVEATWGGYLDPLF